MASPIALVNMALTELGEERLTSLSDTSVRAQSVRDNYDEIRQLVLRGYPFNFATRRAILAPTSTTPAFKWAYQFALPAATANDGGWLRTLGVWADTDERQRQPYEEAEGKYILANVDTLYFKYIVDVQDLNTWDVLARQTFAYRLAARLAITITNSAQREQALIAKAEDMYRKSSSVDSQDDYPSSFDIGSWEYSRFVTNGFVSPDEIDII